MSAYDAFQYGVIGLLVIGSTVQVLRRQAPAVFRRLQVGLALRLLKPPAPPWLRALGRRIAPAAAGAQAACNGCSSGCSTPRH